MASGSCRLSVLSGVLLPVNLRASTTIQHVAVLTFSVTPWVKRKCSGSGILNQIGIDYSLRPRLSTRLTLGGRTFPQESLGFRRAGIQPALSLLMSAFSLPSAPWSVTLPLRCPWDAFLPLRLAAKAMASVYGLSPDHFRRNFARWVSCYALFK